MKQRNDSILGCGLKAGDVDKKQVELWEKDDPDKPAQISTKTWKILNYCGQSPGSQK